MIVTYNWLKEFVDFDLPPAELADLLTMLGLEVEGIRHIGTGLDDVVVAVVAEKGKHPNADKLSLCQINDGTTTFTVVCGAQNFKAGDKVALARIGAVLPGDFKIKRSKIRGEESCGMLCSEQELGLAAESSGIMILPEEAPLGVPAFDALGLKDTIFEIGLTPNRSDCLSVIGIAREIAAKLGKRVVYPHVDIRESSTDVQKLARVTIDAPELCPRYTARHVGGCTIAPSPAWLVKRLEAVGLRSINNVVDVTNYVQMEYGHPLHAFDADLLAGQSIIVRRAGDSERFVTLDGQERQLTTTDLTIRDAERAVALAGIMGGQNSEIQDSTVNILLESAYFTPSAIRKSARRLGLHTESSHRFERGADINILPQALNRAAALIAELAGGTVAKGIIDVYPQPISPRTIKFRADRCAALLGISLTLAEITCLFEQLEMRVEADPASADVLLVTVPTYRVDLEREIDLIEEVARLNGYDKIPVTMPKARILSDRPSSHLRLERQLKTLMVGQGFNEVITFSFMAPGHLDKIRLGEEDPRRNVVKLRNPLVEEQSVMRTSLLPGLLETAARNLNYRSLDLKMFELRRVYQPVQGAELPHEPLYLGGILTGKRGSEGWNQGKESVDFYDVKGVIENVFESFRISDVAYRSDASQNYFHPGKSCSVFHGNELLGSFGEIHPDVQDNFAINQSIFYFELNFEKLVAFYEDKLTIVPPSRFPDTYRDIAMLVADNLPANAIIDCISGLKIANLENALIFDLYKGANIPEGQKSIAVRIRYRSQEKTLTDDEVSSLHQRVVSSLQKKLAASIR